MKVIFLKDVPRVGRKNDVKEVNDGYALNFLFPRKMAELATTKSLASLEQRQKEIVIEREVQENLLERNLSEIKGKTIVLQAKSDDKGHLFSAIHPKDIVKALHEQHKAEIGEQFIDLKKPIKEIGEFEIPIKIKNKNSSFKLIINKI